MKPIDPGADYGELREVAKDQPEYLTLISRYGVAEQGITVTTRWQFSDEERAAIAAGAGRVAGK